MAAEKRYMSINEMTKLALPFVVLHQQFDTKIYRPCYGLEQLRHILIFGAL